MDDVRVDLVDPMEANPVVVCPSYHSPKFDSDS